MVHVQYFEDRDGELVEALGDRGVVILDGRNSIETMKDDAAKFNGYRRPVYAAYQIRRGESFTRCHDITPIIRFKGKENGR